MARKPRKLRRGMLAVLLVRTIFGNKGECVIQHDVPHYIDSVEVKLKGHNHITTCCRHELRIRRKQPV